MTMHGAYSPRAGLELPEPAPHAARPGAACPDCRRASLDNHDFECTHGPRCVQNPRGSSALAWEDKPPAEADPYRALETACRAARAASHERKLDPPVAKALAAVAEALSAAVDVIRVQQRELAALKGVTFGDP